MSESRIPLEVFQQVFYGYIDTRANQLRAFQDGTANDFKITKYVPRVPPKKSPIPKYPHFERTHIPYNPPSTVYHIKDVIAPEPEYQPPPRIKPRKIDPNKLSEKQRAFYGLSAAEQDMLLIEMKRKERAKRSQSVKVKIKEIDKDAFIKLNRGALRKGEDLDKFFPDEGHNYKRINENINQENEANLNSTRDTDINDRIKGKKNQNKRISKYEYQKVIPNQAPQMYLREEGYLNEHRKDVIRYINRGPPKIESYLQQDFRPNRITRSQKLKEDYCRRKIELMEIETRRKELNDEMRRKKEEEAAKRLHGPINRLKAIDNLDIRMRDRKQRMRDDYESYMRSIQALKEASALGQTLLERVANEIDNMVPRT